VEAAVVVALIAAIGSLIVTFGKAGLDAYQKRQEHRIAQQKELERYVSLLHAAAADLGGRVNNIRNQAFFVYMGVGERREIALLSTLFRFGQYFTWVEIYREYLRLNPGREIGAVSDTLAWITATFASDAMDISGDPRTSRLMLWREEQLAIAHLMRRDGDVPSCVDFGVFVDKYESRYSKWFKAFQNDLEEMLSHQGIDSSERLGKLQALLAKLVRELNTVLPIRELGKRAIPEPKWAQPGQYPPLEE
jgi:hypothetical protein